MACSLTSWMRHRGFVRRVTVASMDRGMGRCSQVRLQPKNAVATALNCSSRQRVLFGPDGLFYAVFPSSPMPFGSESSSDQAKRKKVMIITRVTNAFRQRALFGLIARLNRSFKPLQSPMPFGNESSSDSIFCFCLILGIFESPMPFGNESSSDTK